MFVHFPGPDAVGHRDGWGSESQLAALAEVDGWIGKLLVELDRQSLRGSTLILITADHGGAVKNHGGIDARSRYIPFIASGPGVRPNYDLTLQEGLTVHVEDTFATGLEWLGVELPKGICGKPVWAIYQKPPKGGPTAGTSSLPLRPEVATYPDPRLLDVAGAMNALPALPLNKPQAQRQRQTGTYDGWATPPC